MWTVVKCLVLGVVGDVLWDDALHGSHGGHVIIEVRLGDEGVDLAADLRPIIFTDAGDADFVVERWFGLFLVVQDFLLEFLAIAQASVLNLDTLGSTQFDHALR